MRIQHRIFRFIGSALLLTAGSFAQDVKTDYDRAADFNLYKTYSWENVHTENPCGVIESRQRSIPHWRRKGGRRSNPAEMFLSWRWR